MIKHILVNTWKLTLVCIMISFITLGCNEYNVGIERQRTEQTRLREEYDYKETVVEETHETKRHLATEETKRKEIDLQREQSQQFILFLAFGVIGMFTMMILAVAFMITSNRKDTPKVHYLPPVPVDVLLSDEAKQIGWKPYTDETGNVYGQRITPNGVQKVNTF